MFDILKKYHNLKSVNQTKQSKICLILSIIQTQCRNVVNLVVRNIEGSGELQHIWFEDGLFHCSLTMTTD